MDIKNLLLGLLAFFIVLIVGYLILSKVRVRALEWLAELRRRRLIAFVIFLIFYVAFCSVMETLKVQSVEIIKWIPLAVMVSIEFKIQELIRIQSDKK